MKKKILVIGDTILDEYISIDPIKVSDEAHVITSGVVSKKFVLGGATNVARNISSLGGDCYYIGLISKNFKTELLKLFKFYNIDNFLLEMEDSVQIKTRIVSTRGAQVCRYDSNFAEKPITRNQLNLLIKKIESIIENFDFIVISKYYEHFLKKDLVNKIIQISRKFNKLIIVDNRNDDSDIFCDVDFYKMNFSEFKQFYKTPDLKNDKNIIAETVNTHGFKFRNLILTRSNLPTLLFSKSDDKFVCSEIGLNSVEVKDVSGAGDTFVAAFSLNYEHDLEKCINKCHDICNVVVRKMGTSVVWSYEVNNYENIEILCEQLKKNDKKIVFTNGVFDLLHIGHIKILEESKKYGDYLIVGINSDSSVKKLKGPDRPINTENERKKILEAMRFVDKVVIFNDLTCENIIQKIKPNVYVKGGDYNINNLPEKKVLSNVDKVIFVDLINNKSSTKIINEIKGSKCQKF